MAPDPQGFLDKFLLKRVHEEDVGLATRSYRVSPVRSSVHLWRRVQAVVHTFIHVFHALGLLLQRLQEVPTPHILLIHSKRSGRLPVDLFLVEVILLHPYSLTLLASDDALWLDERMRSILFFFDHDLHVFISQCLHFFFRGRLGHRDVNLVAEVAIVIEFHAPSELVAEDLCNLEVRLDVGPQDLFKVLLLGEKLDKTSLAVIQLAG